jgi:hypothetical protein
MREAVVDHGGDLELQPVNAFVDNLVRRARRLALTDLLVRLDNVAELERDVIVAAAAAILQNFAGNV